MRWFKNRKIATKLIASFVLITIIATLTGLVGLFNLNDVGRTKMVAATELLLLQEAYTEIAELDNLFLSQNVDYKSRQEIYETLELTEERLKVHIKNYQGLNLENDFNEVLTLIDAYLEDHMTLLALAENIDQLRIDRPTELRSIIANREKDHYKWIWQLEDSIIKETAFTGELDGEACVLGQWLKTYETDSKDIEQLILDIEDYHLAVHESGRMVNEILTDNEPNKEERAYEIYRQETLPNMSMVLELLDEMDRLALASENLYMAMTDQVLNINIESHDVSGDQLNQLVEEKLEDANSSVMSASFMILVFVIIGAALSLTLGFIIAGMIKKPVKEILEGAESIAKGDLDVTVHIESEDELGQLSKAFTLMTENINEVMSQINAASDEVATGSRELSDSSMTLSQGASEQAASAEQLTAAMEEISSQINVNTEKANHAKDISELLYSNAQDGNQQMDNMLGAMTDIDDASNNIFKIIKVIDEIAFQTNILALNAAVEAARAGVHGKGFAVVAEEVRNLASRSSAAANETTQLIESSMQKVSIGTEIANHTAEALSRIVEEVNRVTSLVEDIAKASKEQSLGVNQVNQGLAQISSVVQSTSVTAEKTANSSEELSKQADLLKAQVAKFHLKKYHDITSINPDVINMLDKFNQDHRSLENSSDFEKY